MALTIGRKHWIVFAVLFAIQAFGMLMTAHRNPINANPEWMYFALFAVPNNAFGWFIASEMVISLCLVTAVIMVTLWDTTRNTLR